PFLMPPTPPRLRAPPAVSLPRLTKPPQRHPIRKPPLYRLCPQSVHHRRTPQRRPQRPPVAQCRQDPERPPLQALVIHPLPQLSQRIIPRRTFRQIRHRQLVKPLLPQQRPQPRIILIKTINQPIPIRPVINLQPFQTAQPIVGLNKLPRHLPHPAPIHPPP